MSARVEIEAALLQGDHRLSSEDLERFQDHAALAVERRNARFWLDEGGVVIGRLAFGSMSLIGLFVFEWPPSTLVLFLFIGVWTSILFDSLKLRMLRPLIEQWASDYNDNLHVWRVAEALRNGQPIRRDHATGYIPILGMFFDYVFTSIASVLLLIASRNDLAWVVDSLLDPTFVTAVALMAVYELGVTAATIIRKKREKDATTPVEFQAGGRGLGLLLVTAVAVAVTHGGVADLGMSVIILANAGIILLGLLGLVGTWFVKTDTEWLRKRLVSAGYRPAQPLVDAPPRPCPGSAVDKPTSALQSNLARAAVATAPAFALFALLSVLAWVDSGRIAASGLLALFAAWAAAIGAMVATPRVFGASFPGGHLVTMTRCPACGHGVHVAVSKCFNCKSGTSAHRPTNWAYLASMVVYMLVFLWLV
jgi:hypothetical protein